jgi:GGDEF domain-containing protein
MLGGRGGIVGRLGESSFGVLIPGIDRAAAVKVGVQVREAVESQSPAWAIRALKGGPLTVSIGVAVGGQDSIAAFGKVTQLLGAAQRAATAASGAGGNSVRTFVPKLAA